MIDMDTVSERARSAHDPIARFRTHGVDALSDAELLGVLLERGRTPAAALRHATRVLDTYGSARSLLRTGFGELALDFGARRAMRLIAAFELSRRVFSEPLCPASPMRSSRDVQLAFGHRLAELPEEIVLAVLLDVKQRPVAERMIARGGPSGCALSVRDIFAVAVREAAVGMVLIHNHPSGDPTPSEEDRQLTSVLHNAGRVIGLPLVDHVIVGRGRVFSFLDAGLLPDARLQVQP